LDPSNMSTSETSEKATRTTSWVKTPSLLMDFVYLAELLK